MKKIGFLMLAFAFLFSMADPGDFQYVGSKKCKMCHKGDRKGNAYEKWEQGRHARALESLKKESEEKNSKCLECHTTAFNRGGFELGDANAADFEGVGCESCHGPGSVYKKTNIMKKREMALKNGLVNITEQTCMACHDGTQCVHAKGFDYKKAMKVIDHSYLKK